jgi:GNAT superfamily N-acetyltransferase
MDNVEIRRMRSGEALQVAYVKSVAFQSNSMFKVIYQSYGEELRKILERMYSGSPHEPFVAVHKGKVIGSIKSHSCTGERYSGHSCSEEEYDYIVNQKIEELSIEQRWKCVKKACESHDLDISHSHVGAVAVLPEFQGKGVGSMLLEDYFSRMDGGVSFLETFTEFNARFYGNRGYRLVAADFVLGVKGYWMKRVRAAPRTCMMEK